MAGLAAGVKGTRIPEFGRSGCRNGRPRREPRKFAGVEPIEFLYPAASGVRTSGNIGQFSRLFNGGLAF